MGFIRIPVIFGDALRKRVEEVFFLVDTGCCRVDGEFKYL